MALRKLPGSKYWMFQTKVNGKTWTRSTKKVDKKQALKEAERLEKLAQRARVNPDAPAMLSEAIDAEVKRIKEEVSDGQSTRVEYALKNFKEYANDVRLERIDTALVEAYQKKRLQDASLTTVNCEICYILRMLKKNGFDVSRPSTKPGKVTLQRAFTHDEIIEFFKVCPERLKPLYWTMLYTGARLAELVPSERSTHQPLLKSEVDFKSNVIRLRTAKQRKGMTPVIPKPRLIAVPPEVTKMLKEQISEMEGKYVFPSLFNSARDFNAVLVKAKIPKFDDLGQRLTAHSFRHSFGTFLSEMVNGNTFILKEALGHRKLTTTERYVHTTAPILQLGIPFSSGGHDPEPEQDGEGVRTAQIVAIGAN